MELLQINTPQLVENVLPFRLSFRPFIHYLRKRKQEVPLNSGLIFLYDYLITRFTPFLDSEALEVITNTESLDELFTLIKHSVLPLIHQGDEIPYAIGLPHHPLTLFHYSETFKRLTNSTEKQPPHSDLVTMRENLLRALYKLVLEKCYHVSISTSLSPWLTIKKEIEGLTKYYRLRIDFRFVEPHPPGTLSPLQPDWIDFAEKNIQTVEELPVPIPLEQFTFNGFCFFLLEDVTEQATLQELKEVFVHLQSEEESGIYYRFEKALRNLCGQKDIQIGLMPFLQVNGQYVHHAPYTSRSIFLRHSAYPSNEKSKPKVQDLIERIARKPEPRIMNDLVDAKNPPQRLLRRNGFGSFIIYPLVVANNAIGMLEIGSPHVGALNKEVLRKIEQAIPMVIELLLYQRNQFKNSMEEIVRQKFTLLQPALEWKFNEAAWAYLRQGEDVPFEEEATQVIFEQVFPFYGAIDVRNSSTERNKAIQQDFMRQFRFVGEILQLPNLPTYQVRPEKLLAKSWYWQRRLIEKISPEDEEQITDFLKHEINPYFRFLHQNHPDFNTWVQPYLEITNSTTGLYQEKYQAYEKSMALINTTVNSYLEQESKNIQVIYPHYFEKFRTDGLEYNLYMGASIAPWLPFGAEHLQQIRYWQLSSMVQMAALTHQLLPNLPLPLQTTQLILAHSHPVDIKFRLDEHRFDVEGSYSIRYEILKKRLDKAHLKGTTERLTQPNTIALVYTTRTEIEEFLPVIHHLQQEKKLGPEIEFLELELLQGVTGLKALRLHINYISTHNGNAGA
ncbi:GAF domain-containing protein [Adhaeribacter radiodurans]|uniref:GAF domain-containing protein n=1 Tax=Adhaeribacter radiodurans TaxID=2745197 RepID=A0A7L7L283_9BACT|nr:GAF domain-containing protein [Adhaeribacter radiodurans]QMU26873.1 GAF domain-containing protein [Adhaeribacter radiodurans]